MLDHIVLVGGSFFFSSALYPVTLSACSFLLHAQQIKWLPLLLLILLLPRLLQTLLGQCGTAWYCWAFFWEGRSIYSDVSCTALDSADANYITNTAQNTRAYHTQYDIHHAVRWAMRM